MLYFYFCLLLLLLNNINIIASSNHFVDEIDGHATPINVTSIFEQIGNARAVQLSDAWCALSSVRSISHEYNHLMGSLKNRVAFCTVPKNACTVLRRFMLTLDDLNPDLTEPYVHAYADHYYGLCNQRNETGHVARIRAPIGKRRQLLVDDGVCRVAVVRDPALRLLSAFIDKGRNDNELKARLFLGKNKNESDSQQRFVDVIERLEHVLIAQRGNVKALRNLDEHFRPQFYQCHFDAPGGLDLWHLAHFERRHIELKRVLVDRCHRPDLWQVLEPLMASRTYHPTFPHRQWQQFYTDDLLERVYRIYRQDYELLRYPKPTMKRFLKKDD